MESHHAEQCPMCGSLMGAEAQPAAMKKAAEIQDQIDHLERRLRAARSEGWTVTVAVVCSPCREALGSDAPEDVASALEARMGQLSRQRLDRMPRSA
jgi:hypothetical protein